MKVQSLKQYNIIITSSNLIRSKPLKAVFTERMWKYDPYLRVHSLNKFAKYSEKLTFLAP